MSVPGKGHRDHDMGESEVQVGGLSCPSRLATESQA